MDKPPCSPSNPCRRVIGPVWTEDQCRWCWRKRYPVDPKETVAARVECSLRSTKRIATATLPVCTTGRLGPVPVYSCPIHNRCIRFGTTDEMQIEFATALKQGESPELWQCSLCKERQPSGP